MKHAVIRVPDSFEFEANHYHSEGRAIVVRCDEADVLDLCRWMVEGMAQMSASLVDTEAPHFGEGATVIGMEDPPEEGP